MSSIYRHESTTTTRMILQLPSHPVNTSDICDSDVELYKRQNEKTEGQNEEGGVG